MPGGPLPSNDMAAFKEILASSRNIIVVAGAGLSAASGLYHSYYGGRLAPVLTGAAKGFRHSEVQVECGENTMP